MLPILLLAASTSAPSTVPRETAGLSFFERRLAQYINEEREDHGLPPLALSHLLTHVAREHVEDLMENRPDVGRDARGQPCTMHSWSSAGAWTPVCFTADNAYATAMWRKPREITHGAYKGDGVEVAFRMSGGVTPEDAIEGWIESPLHASVLFENGIWRRFRWQAMGVAIYGNYAVAWFGKDIDP